MNRLELDKERFKKDYLEIEFMAENMEIGSNELNLAYLDLNALEKALQKFEDQEICVSRDFNIQTLIDDNNPQYIKQEYKIIKSFLKKSIAKYYFDDHYQYQLMSPDEAIILCHDFFKDKIEYQKTLIKQKNDIYFFDWRSKDGAFFIPLFYKKMGYVFVPNNPTAEMVANLCHELVHYTAFKTNYNHLYENGKKNLREIDAIFYQLLIDDYLDKVLNNNDGSVNQAMLYTIVSSQAISIKTKLQMRYLANKSLKEITSWDEMANELQDYFGLMSPYRLEAFFNTNIEQDCYHLTSYIYAIELYELYQSDPELALFKINNFIRLKNKDNYFDELSKLEIIANQNIKNYSLKLTKKIAQDL